MVVAKKKTNIVDPLATAALTQPKGGNKSKELDRIQVSDERVAQALTDYSRLDAEVKKAESDKKPLKDELVNFAKETFLDRLLSGVKSPASFVLESGDRVLQVTIPVKVKAPGQAELNALTEDFGEKAQEDLLEADGNVSLNLNVWNAHSDVLVAALNARDENGHRLVPESVVGALFSQGLRAKEDLFSRVITVAGGDRGKLTNLLYGRLGVGPTLTVKGG